MAPSDSDSRERKWIYYIAVVGAGAVTFPGCLGVFQHLIFKPLHLCSSVALSPVLGFAAVTSSGIIASIGIYVVSNLLNRHRHITAIANCASDTTITSNSGCNRYKSIGPPQELVKYLPAYGVITAAVFKLFSGQFRSVLPSSLLQPGAFARESIPATVKYARQSQRKKIQDMGKKHGCHSCGRWLRIRFYIADHQPPIAVVLQNSKTNGGPIQEQKFYPQCFNCAKKQRYCINKPVRALVTHATSLRRWHFFLPLPLLLPPSVLNCVKDQILSLR